MNISQDMITLFWKNVYVKEEHWYWSGYARPGSQTGIFKYKGREYAVKKLMYVIHNDFINTGQKRIICMCGDDKCINPKHLQLHGMTRTRELSCYEDMVNRILRPNHDSYNEYGGRGIDMDPMYNPDINLRDIGFLTFNDDMMNINVFPLPSGRSIDRIDNNKGYWKDNIKLSTASEQAQNRRTTKLTEDDIRYIRLSYPKKTQKELAIEFNVNPVNISNIINRKRWKNIT